MAVDAFDDRTGLLTSWPGSRESGRFFVLLNLRRARLNFVARIGSDERSEDPCMTKRMSILALLALLGGCANQASTHSARLAASEGVIVYRMTCGPGVAWGQIFRSGESLKGAKAESRRAGILSCREPGVQTQRLPAGRYFVGKIGYQVVVDFDEPAAMQFEVAAGQASYIGHISLPSSSDIGKLLIGDPFVSDWHGELQPWIASNPVALNGQREVITALAQAPSKLIASVPADPYAREGTTEFTVVLKLRVAENGSVKEGHIAKSSGNASLDDTALMDAVRNWQVTSATQGGAAIEKWGNYSVTYRRAY